MEHWKDIKGYEGLYKVSQFGNIRSLDRRSSDGKFCIGKIMKPYNSSHRKYLQITLTKNRIEKKFGVHVLVCRAFINNPNQYTQVNHLDGNGRNNNYTNLEWCTNRQNILHAYATGLKSAKGEKNSQAKLTSREVKFMRYIKGFYPEIKTPDICKFYNMSNQGINDILNFKLWRQD